MTPNTAARILQLHEELERLGRPDFTSADRRSANYLSLELDNAIREGLREMAIQDARRVMYAQGVAQACADMEKGGAWLMALGAAVTAANRGLIDTDEVDDYAEYLLGVVTGKIIEPPADDTAVLLQAQLSLPVEA